MSCCSGQSDSDASPTVLSAYHLGTPVVITDAASFARRRIFEPFGRLVAETELAGYAPPVFFTGKRWESAIAMYDFGARWYDPATAAFGAVDPVIGELANPLSMNAYAYVLHRPMTLVDPDGRNVSVGPMFTGLGFMDASWGYNFDAQTFQGTPPTRSNGGAPGAPGGGRDGRVNPGRDAADRRAGRGQWRGWVGAITVAGARLEARDGEWFVVVPRAMEDTPGTVSYRIPADFIGGLRDILSATIASGLEHGGWGHLDGSFSRWDAVAQNTMPPASFTVTTSPNGTRTNTFNGEAIAAHVHAHPRGGIPSPPDLDISEMLAFHGIATIVVQAYGSIWVGDGAGGFFPIAPTSILGGGP